eukprot:15330506-Ditylum_brightwellii.AAC.1
MMTTPLHPIKGFTCKNIHDDTMHPTNYHCRYFYYPKANPGGPTNEITHLILPWPGRIHHLA